MERHMDTSFFGRCSWMSSMSILTGSGSALLDGIPGSLDGLHKTSWNSLMKDLVVDDVVLALSSALITCLWLTAVDHTMVVSFWNFLWILRFVAQVSSTCREDICMKFSACGLLVLSSCVSEYMMLLLNWWLVNTWLWLTQWQKRQHWALVKRPRLRGRPG